MSTVLKRLSLDAYRGIRALALEGLAPVSLIVGANNAGKSSMLEAAGLLLRPPDPNQWTSAVRHRDFDGALIDGLWSMFPGGEVLHPDDGVAISSAIRIAGTTRNGQREVEATCFASESVGDTDTLNARVEVTVDGAPAITLRFPSAAGVTHEIPLYRVFSVTPGTHYSTRAFVEHLSRVVDEGNKQLAVALLQMFDFAVEDLDVVKSGGREAVRVSHRQRGVVDLASFGDGMRRGAALALALTRATQGVLLVDEIEAGIHHHVLRPVLGTLIDAAATAQVQVLATTHSLEAIDAIIGAVEDRQAPEMLSAFWLQRADDQREVRRYDFTTLCTLRDGGLDIR